MHALSKRLRVPLCIALLWAIALASFFAAAQTINYTYDEAGRLKSVTNLSNETAEYVYDAAGNLN
jgi:YD repeat-containing protein